MLLIAHFVPSTKPCFMTDVHSAERQLLFIEESWGSLSCSTLARLASATTAASISAMRQMFQFPIVAATDCHSCERFFKVSKLTTAMIVVLICHFIGSFTNSATFWLLPGPGRVSLNSFNLSSAFLPRQFSAAVLRSSCIPSGNGIMW